MSINIPLLIFACIVLVVFIWDRRRVGRRVAAIENQRIVPYWQSVQSRLIVDLTHPHPAAERVDELLQLLRDNPNLEMTPEDREELLNGLASRAAGNDPQIGEEERRKAAIFPLVMEEVQKEAANPGPITSVELVGVKKEDE